MIDYVLIDGSPIDTHLVDRYWVSDNQVFLEFLKTLDGVVDVKSDFPHARLTFENEESLNWFLLRYS